jgi:GNAT superfamily N-acetyltransferase
MISANIIILLRRNVLATINYRTDVTPAIEDIIAIYTSAGLNRPTTDKVRMQTMYDNSNLIVTAWNNEVLVGIARSITDFAFCCYLSDLAVHKDYQNKKIGAALIDLTKQTAGDNCMLLLLSAPSAMDYYRKLGFATIDNGFIIKRTR